MLPLLVGVWTVSECSALKAQMLLVGWWSTTIVVFAPHHWRLLISRTVDFYNERRRVRPPAWLLEPKGWRAISQLYELMSSNHLWLGRLWLQTSCFVSINSPIQAQTHCHYQRRNLSIHAPRLGRNYLLKADDGWNLWPHVKVGTE